MQTRRTPPLRSPPLFVTKQTYSSGLGLGNQISSRNSGSDSTLLNSRGLFKTVRVNTTKKGFGQFHTVEGLNDLVPVGVDVGISQSANISAISGCIVWGGITANTKQRSKIGVRKKSRKTKFFLFPLLFFQRRILIAIFDASLVKEH